MGPQKFRIPERVAFKSGQEAEEDPAYKARMRPSRAPLQIFKFTSIS